MSEMDIKEKAAYLRGLAEGYALDDSTPERRLIIELVALVGQMAEELDDLGTIVGDLEEDVEYIEEDIDAITDILNDDFGDEDDEDYPDDEDDEDEDKDEDDEVDFVCPLCEAPIAITDEMLEKGVFPCPACGELLEIDAEDED
jgi:predicted RNA-binding Zn-ribbon protein involved in translation (DUF1610 family)